MFEKFEILFIIIVLLLAFYFVISFGARTKNPEASHKIAKYLFGVRVLIIFIAIVSLILWLLL
jgi:hypothetical protein